MNTFIIVAIFLALLVLCECSPASLSRSKRKGGSRTAGGNHQNRGFSRQRPPKGPNFGKPDVDEKKVGEVNTASCLTVEPTCDGSVTYHEDGCHCNRYFACGTDSQFTREVCPLRGIYDALNKQCVPAISDSINIECGNKRFKHTYLHAVFGRYDVSARDKRGGGDVSVASFTDTAPVDAVYFILFSFQANRGDFTFTTTYDPLTWHRPACINGVCSDSNSEWRFLVDGVDTGISSYILKTNDITLELVDT